jgi:RHS repeat-associated protein
MTVRRQRRGIRGVAFVLAVLLGTLGMPAATVGAATAASPITYVYDELGRLIAAIDPTVSAANQGLVRYTYDDVGNLLSISRASAQAINIVTFHGSQGEVGDRVTIWGTRFNTTPSQNVVRFGGSGGTVATVTAATATTLDVTVPPGAPTGPIFVRNVGTSTSTTSTKIFTVTGAPEPTISSISSATAHPGDTLTITGTRFSPVPTDNVVTIGAVRAQVTAAAPNGTQLTIAVPAKAWSGSIAVRTPNGAVTGPDLFLPTSQWSANPEPANYQHRGRLASGGSQVVSLASNTNDDTAVLLVSANARQTIGGTVTAKNGIDANQNWDIGIFDPFDRRIGGGFGSDGRFSAVANVDGDYSLVITKVTGDAATSGTVNVFVSDVLTVANPVTPPSTRNFTINKPGQHIDYMFHATQGQTVSVGVSHSDFLLGMREIYTPSQPQGDPNWSPAISALVLNGGCTQFEAAETGQHRLVVYPFYSHEVSDVSITIGNGPCGSSLSAASSEQALDAARSEELRNLEALAADYESPDAEDWRPDPDVPSGWVTGYADSPFDGAVLPKAPEGETALSGRVLKLNGEPLEHVTVTVDDVSEKTDVTGTFLLEGLSAGEHEMIVDGGSANRRGARFGLFEFAVSVDRGTTTELDFSVWLPRVDGFTTVEVPTPTSDQIVLSEPSMPGLEIHIPAGQSITDEAGQPIPEIGLLPIPLDRPPFPLPSLAHFPMHFALQPGDAYVDPMGFRIVYPNQLELADGYRSQLWRYDVGRGDWEPYGKATVAANEEHIIPDPGVRAYDFAGASIQSLFASAFGVGCGDEDGEQSGPDATAEPRECSDDPVDLSNGMLRHAETDLVEPGPLPIEVERVYRQNDSNVYYTWGMGVAAPWDMFLVNGGAEASPDAIDLAIPGSHNVRFEQVQGSTTLYRAKDARGSLAGALLEDGGSSTDWLLRRDGTRFFFFFGRLQRVIDRFGNEILYERSHSTANYLVTDAVSMPSGRWVHLEYPTQKYAASVSDALGRRVDYTYETPVTGVTRLKTVIDAKQTTQGSPAPRTYTWNTDTTVNSNVTGSPSPATYLQRITNARSEDELTNVFDGQGRVSTQTFANGGQFTFDYDGDASCPAQTVVTDPTGDVTCATVDAGGYVTEISFAVGTPVERTLTYARQAATHRLQSVTDSSTDAAGQPVTRTITYGYNSNGARTTVARSFTKGGAADTQTVTVAYEPGYSQVASVTDDLGHTTSFSYDYPEGCLTQITDGANKSVDLTCTSSGQVKSVTDALSNQTSLAYAFGDLVRVTDPLQRGMRTFTDSGGRPRVMTDPYGYQTTFAFDPVSNLTKITDARGKSTSLSYDANSNLTEVMLDATGARTTFSYNDIDLVQTRTDPLGQQNPSGHQDLYEYDLGGRLKKWTDRRGNVMRYCYDAAGMVKQIGYALIGPDNGCASTFTSDTAYTWDGWGRLANVVDSRAGHITRTWDELDRLLSDSGPQGSVTYAYDNANRRQTMTIAGQPAINYAYFNNDLLKTITRGTNSVGLTYDAANRPDATTLPNGVVEDWTFDAGGQLTGVSYAKAGQTSLGALSYAYDAAGRRGTVWGASSRMTLPAATTANGTYNLANQMTSWNGATASYDPNGNLASLGSQTYTFNERNELAATSGGSSTFRYDGLGRRYEKVISGTTTRYLYDGVNVAQELNASNAPTFNLLTGFAPDQVFWRQGVSGANTVTNNVLSDGLGSTVATTTPVATPAIRDSFTYTPHGVPSSSAFPYLFTGRDYDSATGLQYNRARYYQPGVGRFTAEDPIGVLGGSSNLYPYAANAPTQLIDPLGLEPGTCSFFCDLAMLLGAVAGLTAGLGIILPTLTTLSAIGIIVGLAAVVLLWATDHPSFGDAAALFALGTAWSVAAPYLISLGVPGVGILLLGLIVFALTVTLPANQARDEGS